MSAGVAIYDPANVIKNHDGIQFTPAAIAHVKKEILKHQALGLRLGVKKAGCSGLKYVIDYVYQSTQEGEKIFIEKDLPIFIDAESLPIFDGVTVDYVREGLNGVLKFINPNEKSSCGCGESFMV